LRLVSGQKYSLLYANFRLYRPRGIIFGKIKKSVLKRDYFRFETNREELMAKTISLINLKGGVGKTTLTIALAEILAMEHGYKTLIVDLDPQANATACLMDLQEWKRRNMRGQTVMRLFLDYFQPWQVFSMQTARVEAVSNIEGGIPGLDLIPSGHELMDIQDRLLGLFESEAAKDQAVFILAEALQSIIQEYDYVLIDCPPNLGLITQNGLAACDYYIVPVVPEPMSMHGIPQIVRRVHQFNIHHHRNIEPLGIVVTKFREQNTQHDMNIKELRAGSKAKGYERVFETLIHESSIAANAVDYYNNFTSVKKKYGNSRTYKEYQQVTEEVLQYSQ
jgi:chromosome partitioning protein